MNPSYIPTRIDLLKAFINENQWRLRQDWQSVDSKRVARQNIADAKAEIKVLELEQELHREGQA